MSLASPFWQGILFLIAGLILLWEIWGGWRRGIIRSAMHFTALVLSGFVGILAGQMAAAVAGKIFAGAAFFIGLFVGSFVTLLVLGLGLLLGAILFKRTAQQPPGMVRFLYGCGGAFFGLLTGLAILWGGITLVRAFGAIAESTMVGQPASHAPTVARIFVTLKESLELGPAGKIVASVDVVPPRIYEMIADQDARTRFFDYPGTQEIMQNPSMAALLQDPALERLDIFSLMQSKNALKAMNDPELQKLLENFDLQKALDYAYPPRQTSPTPEKRP